MVWHERPSWAYHSPPGQICTNPVEERIAVDIVEKDVSFLDPSRVNVMDRARKVYP
jgi:hypothetical protein